MAEIEQDLIRQLESQGCQSRLVPIRHIANIEQELTQRMKDGSFDQDFYKERLTFFTFNPDQIPAGTRSILVVAKPSAQTKIDWTYNGKTIETVLPPTYRGYQQNVKEMLDLLTGILEPTGEQFSKANLPQKLVSVRSGMAKYGRNNITYIDGLGSFYQPMTFFTSLEGDEDAWGEEQELERCSSCRACQIKCPTQAIGEGRFLLHAERCLVFHNERAAAIPFPAWIDPHVHRCVLGCMVCQQYCP